MICRPNVFHDALPYLLTFPYTLNKIEILLSADGFGAQVSHGVIRHYITYKTFYSILIRHYNNEEFRHYNNINNQ